MYCVYGNSSWYIYSGPLYGGGPPLGGSVVGGSTVISESILELMPLRSPTCAGVLASPSLKVYIVV